MSNQYGACDRDNLILIDVRLLMEEEMLPKFSFVFL